MGAGRTERRQTAERLIPLLQRHLQPWGAKWGKETRSRARNAFNGMEWFTGTRFPLQCANCFHTISWQLSNEGYLSRRCSSSRALLSSPPLSRTSSPVPSAATGVCSGVELGDGGVGGDGGGVGPPQDAASGNSPLLKHQHHLLKCQVSTILDIHFVNLGNKSKWWWWGGPGGRLLLSPMRLADWHVAEIKSLCRPFGIFSLARDTAGEWKSEQRKKEK